ncbi:hypothetical protein GCM10017786_15920 [Amycolatopsis deserti]|uniref:Uncharacterized protein n=1 Tax=Amycolatopsis deserti TaxID=185696 RepID=A0ABQ3IMP0_9PSEU|nr:hypothetical protein GCM10017786_15920 [Amycolatopsis deserti]
MAGRRHDRTTAVDGPLDHPALAGDLDDQSGDGLVAELTALLTPGLRDVRLGSGSRQRSRYRFGGEPCAFAGWGFASCGLGLPALGS